MKESVRKSPSEFQKAVYDVLLKEVGETMFMIRNRMGVANEGMDVLASARIREELCNLIEFCVRFDNDEVFVMGVTSPPLNTGDLYVHPKKRTLCVVGVTV